MGERQPLVSPDGNYAITCDGRVDNRKELMASLSPFGPLANDTSDAALILQAYQVWGTDCLQHIIGDFAFALWDGEKRSLLCARDRVGIRPLYYFADHRQFLFGSEIAALLPVAGVPNELNEAMVGLYLWAAFGDGEQTFYKGIRQLLPGHYLLANQDGVSTHCYWELEPDKPIVLGSDAEYVERFRDLFAEAVRCRLRSTTPVAATLSGGLDSSSIVCTAEQMLGNGEVSGGSLQTFSAVFNEFKSADESSYIQLVLDRCGSTGHLMNSDSYWSFKPLQGSYPHSSHPFPIPHQARHEALLDQIQDAGIKVELTGEGGDEILYVQANSYFWHLWITRRWSRMRQDLKNMRPWWRRGFYRQLALGVAPDWLQRLYRGVLRKNAVAPTDYFIIDDDFARRIGLEELLNKARSPKSFKSPYWQDQHTVSQWYGRTFFLSYYSQAALWHGIEARFPFLDSRLIDFVCRIPPEKKIVRDGLTKWLLRQAMQGILPEAVRQRPDKGDFSPLFYRGLDEVGDSGFENLVNNGYLTRLGFVNQTKLAHLFSLASTTAKKPTMQFIGFFSLEQWLRQLFAGGSSSSPIKRAPPIYQKERG